MSSNSTGRMNCTEDQDRLTRVYWKILEDHTSWVNRGGSDASLTLVLKPYLPKRMIINRQPRTIAPNEIPSNTTKISLLGDWTRTPGRRGVTARVVADEGLEPRPNRRRDNVALLYLLALEGLTDYACHRLVGLNVENDDLPQILRAGFGVVNKQFVPRNEPIVRPDRDLEAILGRIEPLD